MVCKALDHKLIRISKERTKKVGVRSINDIINNTPNLTFAEKIAYIRHHYTYYEGNYPMFHHKNGKPNEVKAELNNLIVDVLNKKVQPDVLSVFNKRILEWRKENNIANENIVDSYIPVVNKPTPAWKLSVETVESAKPYICIIDKYLKSSFNDLTDKEEETISYKEIKKKALDWVYNLSEEELDNLIASNRILTDIKDKLLKARNYEYSLIKEKMRQYAKDLGYLNSDRACAE